MRLLITLFLAFFCLSVIAQTPDTLHLRSGSSKLPSTSLPTKKDTLIPGNQIPGDKSLKSDTLSQTVDSSSIVKEKKDGLLHRTFSKNYPNPRFAALLSLILPGAGQAYNKKWYKVPIAWGVLGGVTYFTIDTRKSYTKLRDAYKIKVNGGTPDAPYNAFDAITLKSYRDTFRGYTEKWYLALGVTYLLIVTDAYVDAHLARFDVSDDLSLRFKPSFETSSGLPVFGIGIAMTFKGSSPQTTFSAYNQSIIRP